MSWVCIAIKSTGKCFKLLMSLGHRKMQVIYDRHYSEAVVRGRNSEFSYSPCWKISGTHGPW